MAALSPFAITVLVGGELVGRVSNNVVAKLKTFPPSSPRQVQYALDPFILLENVAVSWCPGALRVQSGEV